MKKRTGRGGEKRLSSFRPSRPPVAFQPVSFTGLGKWSTAASLTYIVCIMLLLELPGRGEGRWTLICIKLHSSLPQPAECCLPLPFSPVSDLLALNKPSREAWSASDDFFMTCSRCDLKKKNNCCKSDGSSTELWQSKQPKLKWDYSNFNEQIKLKRDWWHNNSMYCVLCGTQTNKAKYLCSDNSAHHFSPKKYDYWENRTTEKLMGVTAANSTHTGRVSQRWLWSGQIIY